MLRQRVSSVWHDTNLNLVSSLSLLQILFVAVCDKLVREWQCTDLHPSVQIAAW